ncbi:hypothetical protein L6164_013361 [Bauhinia variegata]|uniref:Uncharacterized protein n=1 Tax=Bauhinia variegata TaxID=167791 RepID=A0ACB9NFN9_BAUVA|nr:hypothetical protein L6164_013361 [Bauhinia variegata]
MAVFHLVFNLVFQLSPVRFGWVSERAASLSCFSELHQVYLVFDQFIDGYNVVKEIKMVGKINWAMTILDMIDQVLDASSKEPWGPHGMDHFL